MDQIKKTVSVLSSCDGTLFGSITSKTPLKDVVVEVYKGNDIQRENMTNYFEDSHNPRNPYDEKYEASRVYSYNPIVSATPVRDVDFFPDVPVIGWNYENKNVVDTFGLIFNSSNYQEFLVVVWY